MISASPSPLCYTSAIMKTSCDMSDQFFPVHLYFFSIRKKDLRPRYPVFHTLPFCLYLNKRNPEQAPLRILVETTRIELVSKNTSAKFSPSASFALCFASCGVQRQTPLSAIPLVPYAAGNSHKVFLHDRHRYPRLQVSPGRCACCKLSSVCEIIVIIFSVYI